MYPEYIVDDEGEQVANLVSITKEQRGQTAFPEHGDSSKYAGSVANSSI